MRSRSILALVIAAAFATQAYAADKTVAVVNGTDIHQSELDALTQQVINGSGGRIKDAPELRAELKQQLVNRQIILQEASRRGLDKSSDFKSRLEAIRGDLLQQSLFEDIARQNPVSESQVKAEYDRIKTQSAGQQEINARQIIVGSEEEAKQIIASLKKGGKFEDLARQKSKDPAAKQTGGDMGWGNLSLMPKPLADALRGIGKGKVSAEPFRSDLGWHIFKVENSRDVKLPSYDQARQQLTRQMQNAQIEKTLVELRNKAKIQ